MTSSPYPGTKNRASARKRLFGDQTTLIPTDPLQSEPIMSEDQTIYQTGTRVPRQSQAEVGPQPTRAEASQTQERLDVPGSYHHGPSSLPPTRLAPDEHTLARIAPKVLFPPSPSRDFPNVDVLVTTLDTTDRFKINALLDSGATGLYVDRKWIDKHNISTTPLDFPLLVYNADGTPNTNGKITHEVELRFIIQGHATKGWFHVVDLGNKSMIIGMSWLRDHNPVIDWETGRIEFKRCPTSCGGSSQTLQNIQALILESKDLTVNISDSFINEIQHEIKVTTVSTKLAVEAYKDKKVHTMEDILKGPYAEFADIFSEEGFQELPPHRTWDHAIDLTPDWETKRWKPRIYPLAPKERESMNQELDDLLKSGRIRSSKSPLGSPVFYVAKKDGKMRMVVDYRKLNDITVKNAYPLPLIPDLIDKWRGCQYFTLVDVRGAFHGIRIKKGDEWKTAFTTHRGLFEWMVMPFGLANAPATFQNMMNDIFVFYIRRGDTGAYIDDVLIGTRKDLSKKLEDLQFHEKSVKEVFQVFREQKIYLKPEKCVFSQKSVQYLGYVISGDMIAMDPVKVAAVADWPTPKNLKQTRSFLGFANFYRRFISNYSKLARPLNNLTKKDKPFKWEQEEETAFKDVIKALTSAPVLVHPNFKEPFLVEADSSYYAIGAILSQKQEDGRYHPCAYFSHTLQDAEQNWEIHDKELFSIIAALKEWRHYLIQSPHPITVLNDHQNLQYFRNVQNLKPRQARWAEIMEDYKLVLKHRPGTASGKPDALSRQNEPPGENPINKNRILLPEEMFINALDGSDQTIRLTDQIINEQLKDPLIKDILTKLESEKMTGWTGDDGLWRYHGKIYAPSSMRRIVFSTLHLAPTAGHQGIKPTIDLVGRYYYWPELKRDVTLWVQQCDSCQRNKTFPAKKVGQLKPNQIPTRPWEIVSMDLLTDLPESEGYDTILVVVDRFSKMIRLIRTTKKITSFALARLCWDNVWKDFGVPQTIISDRGPQFASNFIKSHNEMLGITTSLSTAYHPQSDGQSERMIQEVQKTLRMYVNHFQNDWASKLSFVEFASNNAIKSSTGYTPFFLVTGQHPNPGSIPRNFNSRSPSAEEFVKGLEKAREKAKEALEKAAEQMKKFADKKRSPAPNFQIGDKVLLDSSNYPSERPSRKLSERRYGPFKIIEKISDLNYRLQLPDNWKIHPVFHVDQLRKYVEDPSKPNFTEPPPDLIEDKEEYEVEEILDADYRIEKGTRKRTLHFLVKWVGYHSKDNTWEPLAHVSNSPAALADFYKANPSKPMPDDDIPPPTRKPQKGRKKHIRFMGHNEIHLVDDAFIPLDNKTDVTTWPIGPITAEIANLWVKLLSPNATLPSRGSKHAAGYDLSSAEEINVPSKGQALVKTDISIQIPKGTYARIAPRSGLALKYGINVGAGVVDFDYTGPIGVILFNHGTTDFKVNIGDRVAQLILERHETPNVVLTKEIGPTERGTSGFGSTGLSKPSPGRSSS